MAAATQQPIIVKSGGSGSMILLGLGAAAAVGGYFAFLKPYLEKQKNASNLKMDQASTIKPAPGKKLYDLNGKPITSANLSIIAADIHDTLEAWGPNDGARVVRVFKSTPFGYVPKLEEFYLNRYGKSLRDHLVSELKDKDWISIKYWFK